jgi:SAM-dependent methyltransferase
VSRVTGERVVTAAGGFNPTWQRHVAAYAECERFLPPGRVLDLGCGVGHSYELLAPRETVGVDLDAGAIVPGDFSLAQESLAEALDVVAVCRAG